MTISSSKLMVVTVLAFLLLGVSFMKFSTPTSAIYGFSNNYQRKVLLVCHGKKYLKKLVPEVSGRRNLVAPLMRRRLMIIDNGPPSPQANLPPGHKTGS
ncbi:hypothetical protein Nepgr_003095 [Nepenthes gracilis]|uniref:Transmembrane protein n=1 Tax=Nepenthes gracilis TaxID=150966 RepID=A0AAD3RYW6_NEPGR|nr:hypothetical protein Nepgr_003095 [Nepenthes gracilis]